MSFLRRLFGERGQEPLPPTDENPTMLYQSAMNLFKGDQFQEALDAFERLSLIDSSSAPVHFMLGMTYIRLGGVLCKDNDSLVPWLRKSVVAFKKALDLAEQYGGLTAEQRKTAADCALHGERVTERHSPSLPKERRREIFGDLMETIDTELMLGTGLADDFAKASEAGSFKMMADSLKENSALAEDAALSKIMVRYGISRGQALAIEEEGRENKWPIKAIPPGLFNNRLLAAVKKGDSSEVEKLLGAGANADSVDENGESAIFIASTNGNARVVDLLLGSGADANVDRGDQVFPLHRAAKGGFVETVRSLIRGGADVNVATRFRITPLHSASFEGHSDVVELLLQAGAFVDAPDTANETPLLNAIRHGHAQPAIRLIEAGADVNRACRGGMSPLLMACSSGMQEVVERLIDAGADVNLGDDAGKAPLHEASENGFRRIVAMLLKAGAHVNATYFEATPLFCAAEEGHVDVVELLLSAGADRTIAQGGKTPRDIAAEAGHDAVVKALEDPRSATAAPAPATPQSNPKTLGQTCPTCHGATANDSDAFFRSFDVSYSCKCGGPVTIDGKTIDRLLGIMVRCAKCGAISYLPPTVWCQRCGQNLVGNWESLVVKDSVDEATTKFSRAARAAQPLGAVRHQRFRPPQDAQRLKPPLMRCQCDKCGKQEWWTPDGHSFEVADMMEMEDPIIVRCLACGRWAIVCE